MYLFTYLHSTRKKEKEKKEKKIRAELLLYLVYKCQKTAVYNNV